jgi:hypothetical protein
MYVTQGLNQSNPLFPHILILFQPKLGDLGISHLQEVGWALRMRWLWLQKTEPDKALGGFPNPSAPCGQSFL